MPSRQPKLPSVCGADPRGFCSVRTGYLVGLAQAYQEGHVIMDSSIVKTASRRGFQKLLSNVAFRVHTAVNRNEIWASWSLEARFHGARPEVRADLHVGQDAPLRGFPSGW